MQQLKKYIIENTNIIMLYVATVCVEHMEKRGMLG